MNEAASSCASCCYSFASPDALQTRFCRRHPPTLVPVPNQLGQIGFASQFPPVLPNMTCGEYKGRVVLQ